MSQHDQYHYSVTILTDDEAVLHCLRALSQYAQMTGNVRIPWGGTKKKNWKQNRHCATFHFTSLRYRKIFVEEANRLLPNNLWEVIDEDDNDPATPQT